VLWSIKFNPLFTMINVHSDTICLSVSPCFCHWIPVLKRNVHARTSPYKNYCEAQYYYTYIIKSCTQHNIHRRQQQWGRNIRDSSGPTFSKSSIWLAEAAPYCVKSKHLHCRRQKNRCNFAGYAVFYWKGFSSFSDSGAIFSDIHIKHFEEC
jgi:hypothetical protein